MMDLIAQCPPGPWPNAWGTWDNTIETHRRLVDQYIDNLKPSRVTYAQERGIDRLRILGVGDHGPHRLDPWRVA